MTASIHGLGTPGAAGSSKTPAAPARATASGSSTAPVAAASATAAADSVELSPGAMGLMELPAGDGTEVDHVRVAALRAALRDGSYRIDPQSIAARLAALERELLR